MIDAQQDFGQHVLVVRVGVCPVRDFREFLEGLQEVVGEAAGQQREVLVAVAGTRGQRAQDLDGGGCGEPLALVRGGRRRKLIGVVSGGVVAQLRAQAVGKHLPRSGERFDDHALPVAGHAQGGAEHGQGLETGAGRNVRRLEEYGVVRGGAAEVGEQARGVLVVANSLVRKPGWSLRCELLRGIAHCRPSCVLTPRVLGAKTRGA